ncbi:hypothetical protein [Streptomyces omiyaensis]|uniref:Uncharacterized protein n=1 Tax=Streptomyces omiyaensis TaxID=68247 RepID=A0ABW7C3V8_9ACTN
MRQAAEEAAAPPRPAAGPVAAYVTRAGTFARSTFGLADAYTAAVVDNLPDA